MKSVWPFLIKAFLITWVFWGGAILLQSDDNIFGSIFYLIGSFGPLIAVFWEIQGTEKVAFRKDFLYRMRDFKPLVSLESLLWIMLFPLLLLTSTLIYVLFGGDWPMVTCWSDITGSVPIFVLSVLSILLVGPVAEEPGWRGFLQDKLAGIFGFSFSAIFVGLIWWVWHWPMFFIYGTWQNSFGFLSWFNLFYLLMILGTSLIMAFAYFRNNRSIWLAILMHFSVNFSTTILSPFSESITHINTILILISALIITFVLPKTFISSASSSISNANSSR